MADPTKKKYAPGDTASCRRCKTDFVVSLYQVKHGKYLCSGCQVQSAASYRLRNLEKAREWSKRSAKRNVARRIAWQREYRKKFPEKYKARMAVQTALRNGTLTRKPCAKCDNPKSEAHHADYSRPLEVSWFCRICHLKEHGAYNDPILLAELDRTREQP